MLFNLQLKRLTWTMLGNERPYRLIGMPNYSRHVGQALKLSGPGVAPPLPWHRVISSSGVISSRGPNTTGAERQKQALEEEDVEVTVGRTGA
ncbi:hypothetical protein F5876DRAFT_77159 [Lentinula aff. lateritia]|uniref:Uncharacterized protein n=1 Tax=Lentinula aff. lateritia TaxID=2804960 RepID=A0ACC1TZG4_9AGAR|nr:hypothetical protein F5876DRAFT_77159 [Lentinula aff. lateritia]